MSPVIPNKFELWLLINLSQISLYALYPSLVVKSKPFGVIGEEEDDDEEDDNEEDDDESDESFSSFLFFLSFKEPKISFYEIPAALHTLSKIVDKSCSVKTMTLCFFIIINIKPFLMFYLSRN